jgi:hypothetical protein
MIVCGHSNTVSSSTHTVWLVQQATSLKLSAHLHHNVQHGGLQDEEDDRRVDRHNEDVLQDGLGARITDNELLKADKAILVCSWVGE